MIYRARYLVTMQGQPLPWGCLRVRDGVITEVAAEGRLKPAPGEETRDFPDGVILPGLINAHCHLELGLARSLLPCGEAFPIWVSRLRRALDGVSPDQYYQAARLGALECLKNGITTVVDVGNTGEALRALASLPIRAFAYLELIGLDPNLAEEKIRRATETLAALPAATERFHPGLTCHAPYSCSPELLRRVGAAEGLRGGPFALHVAESREETAMFRDARGALLEFCLRIHPALEIRKQAGPIAFLAGQGLIPRRSLFAHCNLAGRDDWGILADTETSVVHCPRSREFFDHPDPPLAQLRAAGVNLCLGTDSLASNESLNLFDEMATLHRRHPDLPCRQILEMATVNGAQALGLGGGLGVLAPGARADFIAIHLRHHPEWDLFEEIVSEAREVSLVVVDGESVVS